MFNSSLKDEALRSHRQMVKEYEAASEKIQDACERLHSLREDSMETIKSVQDVINSISNTTKEFRSEAKKVDVNLKNFHKTMDYAQKAYESSLKAGGKVFAGASAGVGVAAVAPTALMSVATTFGTASTGTAISALSGAAAQKAAAAWIGRTFAGFAVKEGAGMLVGNALLSLAGPIGWGIAVVSIGTSLISLSNKNKELADQAFKEVKEIKEATGDLNEKTGKIEALELKTLNLLDDLSEQEEKLEGYRNADYLSLKDEDRLFLGAVVNNTLSLSTLINEVIN